MLKSEKCCVGDETNILFALFRAALTQELETDPAERSRVGGGHGVRDPGPDRVLADSKDRSGEVN